jgi:streptogramin lyase
MHRALRTVVVVLAVVLPTACGPSGLTGGNGSPDSVSAELTVVPAAGVQCIRLTITMGPTVERQLFSVTPGQNSRLTVGGLFPGPATFSGDAFDLACSAVTGKSFPTWTSDSQTVTLSAGTLTKVFLTFRQNVQAIISLDFVGQPTFQEFPIPSGGAPYLITWGFSGDLWFTEREANRVAKITSAGVITEFDVPTPGSLPEGIGTLGGADAWFTEFAGNKIGHVTSAGVFQEFPIPTPGSGPRGIIVGPTGGFWFVEYFGNKVGFINNSGAITEFPIPTPNSGPVGIDWTTIGAGSDKLWFTESNAGKVASISFVTGVITEYPVPSGPGLGRISSAYDGIDFDQAMWFVESNADKVGSIAFTGAVTEYNLQGTPSPFDVNYAFDGNGYVPEPSANLIARINPVGVVFEFEPPTPNSQPFSVPVAGGPDAKIWFTERAAAKIGTMTFP